MCQEGVLKTYDTPPPGSGDLAVNRCWLSAEYDNSQSKFCNAGKSEVVEQLSHCATADE